MVPWSTGRDVQGLVLRVAVGLAALLAVGAAGQGPGSGPPRGGFRLPTPAERARAYEAVCRSQLRQLVSMLVMYSQDNGGRLPAGNDWPAAIKPYMPPPRDLMRCPADGKPHGYALNAVVAGKVLPEGRLGQTLMLFEVPGGNAPRIAAPTEALRRPRHPGGILFAYGDMQVRALRAPPTAPAR